MNNDLIPISTLPPFKRICMTIGELPTSYLETMTYYEMLVWFTEYMKNTIIPTINNNGLAVQELQEKYIELKSFIDNYFDNLDVQEEINNKLDEMAESGQLTDIIAQYLGLAGMLVFSNVAALKNAENLVNGSICKTIGFYNENDGGEALYRIRNVLNTDVVNEMDLIALNDENLVAELIIQNNTINMKQVGCSSTLTDNSTIINTIIQNYCNNYSNNKNIYFPADNYPLTHTIEIEKGHFIFDGGKSTFLQNTDNIPIIEFTYPTSPLYTSDFTLKDVILSFNNQQTENNGYGIKFDHMVYNSNFENITIIKPYIGIGCVSNMDESLWKISWKQILINSFYYRGFDLLATTGAPQNYFENLYFQCNSVTINDGCCFYAQNLQAVIDNIEINTNVNGCEMVHLISSTVDLGNFVCETFTANEKNPFYITSTTLNVNNLIITNYDGTFSNNSAIIANTYSSINIDWLKLNKKSSATGNFTIVRNYDTGGAYNHITKIERIGNSQNQKIHDYTLTATNGKGLVEVGKEPMANYQTLNANTVVYGDIFIKQLTGNVNLTFDNTTIGGGFEYNFIINDCNSQNLTIDIPHYDGTWHTTAVNLTDTNPTTYKIVFTGRAYNLGWLLYKNGQIIQTINL